mmetsp:Transcript_62628/g.71854  ORF Transcript_62628/g.71854 Transcript_62628/m.71854 type:complete len:105 (+) Transcript_62628:413-727(+)
MVNRSSSSYQERSAARFRQQCLQETSTLDQNKPTNQLNPGNSYPQVVSGIPVDNAQIQTGVSVQMTPVNTQGGQIQHAEVFQKDQGEEEFKHDGRPVKNQNVFS